MTYRRDRVVCEGMRALQCQIVLLNNIKLDEEGMRMRPCFTPVANSARIKANANESRSEVRARRPEERQAAEVPPRA